MFTLLFPRLHLEAISHLPMGVVLGKASKYFLFLKCQNNVEEESFQKELILAEWNSCRYFPTAYYLNIVISSQAASREWHTHYAAVLQRDLFS